MRVRTGYCVLCGEEEEDHCLFEDQEVPEECVCWRSWDGEVDDICEEFDDNGNNSCKSCHHDKECHPDPDEKKVESNPNQLPLFKDAHG